MTKKVGIKDVAVALMRIADSLDRLVWVVENIAEAADLVRSEDIGPSERVAEIVEEDEP